ncbi:hypothetical protein JCM24511_08028 [Saitozyma sp. JCM 24511]|nr:hypothetical protein JCM24511_08028 [Saitozyma sp. JCM 24511]
MSAPPRKVARPRAALVAAAAAAQGSSSTPPANNTSADPTPTATPAPPTTPAHATAGAGVASHPPATGSSSSSAASHAVPMVRAQTVSTNGDTGSARSTPALSDAPGGSTQAAPLARMKFKPKIPIRRVKKEVDVKPEIPSAPAPSRGGARGRGRGGSTRGGRGAPVPSTSIAAGPFGAARLTPSSWGARRPNSSAPRFIEDQDIDQYSDNEDDVTPGETRARRVIDMAEVSALGESAPTSLVRDRRLNEKGKVKAESKIKKDKEKEKKRRARRESDGGQAMDVDDDVVRVKPEPISPEKRAAQLPPRSGAREDDAMVSDDEVQDRDERGRRLRVEAGEVLEEVNTAQMVDLSESEDEDYEEDMEGDFIPVDGLDNPQDKLYIFQFPHLFPRFEAPGPVDMTQEDTKEGIKDVKPSLAALRGRKKAAPPPQGRIGTLVVMKSGKVKMVMGDDIVMNVNTGVPATFLQHLVHMDAPHKAAAVLGEVNKHFVVTPDVDRLLQELYISGGVTPGDKEAQDRKRALRDGVKLEPGLVKMED